MTAVSYTHYYHVPRFESSLGMYIGFEFGFRTCVLLPKAVAGAECRREKETSVLCAQKNSGNGYHEIDFLAFFVRRQGARQQPFCG